MALVGGVAPAHAAFAGENGRIAFQTNYDGGFDADPTVMSVLPDGTGLMSHGGTRSGAAFPVWSPDGSKILFHASGPRSVEIYTMNADGAARTQLTDNCCTFEYDASWSPDGAKIVFVRSGQYGTQIATMNADGSNQKGLTLIVLGGPGPQEQVYAPAWSPDGKRIAYVSTRDGNTEIYTMDAADGSNPVRLTNHAGRDFNPAWSPDGTEIAFERSAPEQGSARHVYLMDADGSNARRLLDSEAEDYGPTWSPDGSMIAYVGWANHSADIWVMHADGSSPRQVAPKLATEQTPDWQALPPQTGYPRPQGATRLRVSLVPAFRQCTEPNSTHGEPLAIGSCAPPQQASSRLTVGTPDSNGEGARSVSSILYRVVAGDPATPASEADVRVDASVTDVRVQGSLDDYTGELGVDQTVQITDRMNGSAQDEPGTVVPTPFRFGVPCVTTDDPAVGATCSLSATFNAILPGAVQESNRAIWEVDEVWVMDGGDDNLASTTAGNGPFQSQGVFVP